MQLLTFTLGFHAAFFKEQLLVCYFPSRKVSAGKSSGVGLQSCVTQSCLTLQHLLCIFWDFRAHLRGDRVARTAEET